MKFLVISKEDLIRMIACLLLGILLGGISTNILMGKRYDELLLTNQTLLIQLEEDKQRLKQLEKDTNGTPIVKKVVLKLFTKEDIHTETDLEEKIKELLTGLVGLEINQLDTTILRDILHERSVILGEDAFILAVETIIVDDELTFIVRAEKQNKNRLVEEE